MSQNGEPTKITLTQQSELEIPRWEEYQKAKTGTPKEIAAGFRWATHFAEIPQVKQDIADFLARHLNFPFSAETLTQIVSSGYQLLEEVWQALFPHQNPLPYHNLDHGKNTGITTLELFLGAIVHHQLYDLPNLETLTHTFFIVGLLHEIDDWWNLEAVQQTKGYDLEKAKNLISDYLSQHELSTHDFNRFLKLNQFALSPEKSIAQAKALSPEEGFLPQNEISSAIDALETNQQELLWRILENCLGATDFLQIINPAYTQPAEIIIEENRLSKICGPVTLAVEMERVRPGALTNLGWATKERGVNWEKVGVGKSFWENLALPRINAGIDYLRIFSPVKSQRVEKCLKILPIRNYFYLSL